MKKLWDCLDGPDAAAAWQAIVRLAGAPDDAAPFLGERLRPPAPVRRVGGLIADLDSDSFEVREKASQELERLGVAAAPALQEARSGRLSLEARRRVNELLRKLGDKATGLVPGELRLLRAIEALEHMGTPAARRALEARSKSAPKSPAGRAAKASLARLAGRP